MGLRERYAAIRAEIPEPEFESPNVASVRRFCEEQLVVDPGAKVRSLDVWTAYEAWAKSIEMQPVGNQAVLGRHITKLGIERYKLIANTGVITWYLGVNLEEPS